MAEVDAAEVDLAVTGVVDELAAADVLEAAGVTGIAGTTGRCCCVALAAALPLFGFAAATLVDDGFLLAVAAVLAGIGAALTAGGFWAQAFADGSTMGGRGCCDVL